MPLPVIVNSIVCIAGSVIGILFAGASIISIANMTVPWTQWLVIAALLIPIMFVVSGIGMWLAYDRTFPIIVIGLVLLPWVYSTGFVLLMLRSFEG